MSKPKTCITNLETGEVIVREYTDEEFADFQLDQAAEKKRENELKSKSKAKIALLEKLGITEEEAKLLIG